LIMLSAKTDSKPKTTRDSFLDGRLTIVQPASGPRTAIDALFLAAAVPAQVGRAHRVLEAGAGTGVVSLAICARVDDAHITGVEVQGELAALARENAALNGFDDRCAIIEADITESGPALKNAGLLRESFDHVVANPPFYTQGRCREASNPQTAKAYSAGQGELEKWIKFLTTMATPRATLTLIHRAEALAELLRLLEGRFGGIAVYPLFPREGEPAKRILVQGIKGSRAPVELLPGMVLHKLNGDYTESADEVLRGLAGLTLSKMKK
jgi:tRNA1(Val) A37 N6-methylase TrmN6